MPLCALDYEILSLAAILTLARYLLEGRAEPGNLKRLTADRTSKMKAHLLTLAALLTLGLCACSGEDPASNGEAASGGSAGAAGTAGTAGSAGSAGNTPQSVGVDPKVSTCGGFAAANRDADPYCDAELLKWAFDASSGTLSLLDQRVLLNCCGDHEFSVTFDPARGVYTATETDRPESIGSNGQGERCDCLCVFDWAIDVADVEPGTIQLELERHETDSAPSPHQVWAGAIDLSEVQGEIVIDPNPIGYGCNPYE